MNFFQQQEIAKKQTTKLVCFFVLAVIVTIFLSHMTLSYFVYLYETELTPKDHHNWFDPFWDKRFWHYTIFGVSFLVLIGIVHKLSQMKSGGKAIVDLFGARRVNSDTRDPKERQLLNVVEEMSIAAGLPVLPVYLIEARGINALTAGYDQNDAVLMITDASLEYLDRDQLQAMIAHEFSHVFNGDMNLNIKLVSMLNGLSAISMTGKFVIEIIAEVRFKKSWIHFIIVFFGLLLIIVGYFGLSVARIIKAAISRQREYLADASAVQFTRNKQAVVGLLKTIGGLKYRGRILNPAREEVSHMFFCESSSYMLGGLLATHPGLRQRILKIDSSFDGVFPPIEAIKYEDDKVKPNINNTNGPVKKVSRKEFNLIRDLATAPQENSILAAAMILSSYSNKFKETVHHPLGAQALIYALLFSSEQDIKEKQKSHLKEKLSPEILRYVDPLDTYLSQRSQVDRLPLIEMASPVLKEMSVDQYQSFEKFMQSLIEIDQKVSLQELLVKTLTGFYVKADFIKEGKPIVRYHTLPALMSEINMILSLLAIKGHAEVALQKKAHEVACRKLFDRKTPSMIINIPEDVSERLEKALLKLRSTKPIIKERILSACQMSIFFDKKVSIEEVELLRITAAGMNCPIPPLLPDEIGS